MISEQVLLSEIATWEVTNSVSDRNRLIYDVFDVIQADL